MKTVIGLLAMLVLQQDLFAQITWRRSYGGYGFDLARAVRQTPEGGYIVAGSTGSFGAGGDGYVLKLDELGELEWSHYLGDAQVDEFWDVEVLDDGYLLAGITASPSNGGYDGLLVRLDATGALQWRRNYGTVAWDLLYSLDVDATGYFLAGTTYGGAGMDGQCWILRTDLDGEVVWSTDRGGAYDDEARSVHATMDGGCVIAGSTELADGTFDAYVVKVDPQGDQEWELALGTDSTDKAFGLDLMEDGNIIIGGYTRGFSTYQRLMMAKVDPNGQEVWYRDIGLVSDWEGHAVQVRPEGGFAMAAYTTGFGLGGRDMYLLLTDEEVVNYFGTTYGGSDDDEAFAVDLTADGGYVVAGSTDSHGPGPRAVFVVKTGADGLTEFQTVEDQFDPVGIPGNIVQAAGSIHPNPVCQNTILNIPDNFVAGASYAFIDGLSRVVAQGRIDRTATIPVPSIGNGVYVLRIGEHASFTVVISDR